MKTNKILLLISWILIVTLSINGCSLKDEKSENINLLELLIEPTDMPPNWSLANYGINKAIDPYRSSDAAGIVFLSDLYPEAFGVGQEVYRFKTIARAKSDYEDALNILQQPDSYFPDNWNFQSQIADDNYFSCSVYPNITICNWVARYKNIVIELGAPLIEGYFNLRDMEKLIKIIDEKAGSLILK